MAVFFKDDVVFPAQAGVIPGHIKSLANRICIPRASGGDPGLYGIR